MAITQDYLNNEDLAQPTASADAQALHPVPLVDGWGEHGDHQQEEIGEIFSAPLAVLSSEADWNAGLIPATFAMGASTTPAAELNLVRAPSVHRQFQTTLSTQNALPLGSTNAWVPGLDAGPTMQAPLPFTHEFIISSRDDDIYQQLLWVDPTSSFEFAETQLPQLDFSVELTGDHGVYNANNYGDSDAFTNGPELLLPGAQHDYNGVLADLQPILSSKSVGQQPSQDQSNSLSPCTNLSSTMSSWQIPSNVGSSSNRQGSMSHPSDNSWIFTSGNSNSDGLDRLSNFSTPFIAGSAGDVENSRYGTRDINFSETPLLQNLAAKTSSTAQNNRNMNEKELKIVQYGEEEPRQKSKKRGINILGDESPKKLIRSSKNGEIQGIEIILGESDRKVKRAYGPAARRAVACCRATGACAKCRQGKKKCDLHEKSPYEPCTPCASLKTRYKGLPRLPCFLSRICEAIFFRKGPSFQSPRYFERQTVCRLIEVAKLTNKPDLSATVRTLELCQIFGAKFEVSVTEFEPQPGDKVTLRQVNEDGEIFTREMPPYALANIDQIRRNMEIYVRESRDKYLALLRDETDVTWLTTKTAIAYADKNPDSMTKLALDIWANSRVIERSWTICGEDTLDMPPTPDPKSPWYGCTPITPIMAVQLDQIVIRGMLNPTREKLLTRLEEAILQNSRVTWFDSYLCIYMLLNHIEWACAHGNKFSKRHGLGRRYSDMKLAESWFHTCKILLSRFHFITNGSAPLRLDWTNKKNVQFAQLDKDQVQFLRKTQELMKAKDTQLEELSVKYRYERDLYWTHQMFKEQWDSGLPHIVDEVTA